MLKLRWLILAFIISFLTFLVMGVPARFLVEKVPSMSLAGAPLMFGQAQGTVWNGAAVWRWRDLQGLLMWQPGFSLSSPALNIQLSGDLDVQGRVSGWSRDAVAISVTQGKLPARLIEHVSPFKASGELEITDVHAVLSEGRLSTAEGELRYGGGLARWDKGEKQLPALNATIEPIDQGARVSVRDDTKVLMMDAMVQGNMGKLRVFRAWPILLGVSQGGKADDVIFTASRPLWP